MFTAIWRIRLRPIYLCDHPGLGFSAKGLLGGAQVDVYSFGVVLWELWTGREPFEGLNYHALLHQITSAGVAVRPPMPGTPEWDSTEGGEAPPEPAPGYRALVERCWNEHPAKRPAFEAIVRDLAAAVQVRLACRVRGDRVTCLLWVTLHSGCVRVAVLRAVEQVLFF